MNEMVRDDSGCITPRHKRIKISESEADVAFISSYLNAIGTTGMYKLSDKELEMQARTKTYNFADNVRYCWIDSVTGKKTVSYKSNFSSIVSEQIYELFKENQDITDPIQLLDKYVGRYDNLPIVFFVMDSNEYELKQLRDGVKYPYLISKLNRLFNISYLKSKLEEERVLGITFGRRNPGMRGKNSRETAAANIRNRLKEFLPTMKSDIPYSPDKFKRSLIDNVGYGAVTYLIRLAYEWKGVELPADKPISVCVYLKPYHVHPILKEYLDHLGIQILLRDKKEYNTREAKRARFDAISFKKY